MSSLLRCRYFEERNLRKAQLSPTRNATLFLDCCRRSADTCHFFSSGGHDSSVSSSTQLLKEILSRFQGDFDNYEQVISDVRCGWTSPREGGGHEHIHGVILPIVNSAFLWKHLHPSQKWNEDMHAAVLVAFYFDGVPSRIFRFRLYTFAAEKEVATVRMKLHTLPLPLETALKDKSCELWAEVLSSFLRKCEGRLEELQGCDVIWSRKPHPTRHSYLHDDDTYRLSLGNQTNEALHALMEEADGVIVSSRVQADTFVRIKDELSLWEDDFWLNDRGYRAFSAQEDVGESLMQVYGNWRGTPYKMKRVSRFEALASNSTYPEVGMAVGVHETEIIYKRVLTNRDLAWTLGDVWNEGY